MDDQGMSGGARRLVGSKSFPEPALVPGRRPEESRFLFYSHDGVGLGHVRRNITIASALQRIAPQASVLLATSVDEVERMDLPPNVDIVKLPGLRKLDNEHYAARRLRVPWEEVRELRAKLLAAAVESFRPGVLLVDKHPLGVRGELLPALRSAKAAGARAVLGLRDVLDDPATVRSEWTSSALFERIPGCYNRVLVYGQANILDPVREYGFPEELARMTFFCGYVFGGVSGSGRPNHPRLGVSRDERRRPLVLATAGGGEDGFALLAQFLRAAKGVTWEAIAVTGPQCPERDRRRLFRLAAEAGVECRTFVSGLSSYFAATDALVCMAGYNTLTEAVASGAPTVCVPRVRPRREQLLRARAFARLGLVRTVDADGLAASALRAEIDSALRVSRRDLMRNARAVLELDGAPRTARHLLDVAEAG
jgi:predicted glycosyltransferase